MIKVVDKDIIRRLHLVQGWSERRIARELGFARETVRKYLREERDTVRAASATRIGRACIATAGPTRKRHRRARRSPVAPTAATDMRLRGRCISARSVPCTANVS